MAKVMFSKLLDINIPFTDDTITYCTDDTNFIYINTIDSIYKYDVINGIINKLATKPSSTSRFRESECVYYNGYVYYLISNSGTGSVKWRKNLYKCDVNSGVITNILTYESSHTSLGIGGNFLHLLNNNRLLCYSTLLSSGNPYYSLNIVDLETEESTYLVQGRTDVSTKFPFGVLSPSTLYDYSYLQTLILNNNWYNTNYITYNTITYNMLKFNINNFTSSIFNVDTTILQNGGLCLNKDNPNSFYCLKGNSVYEYDILSNTFNVVYNDLPKYIEYSQAINFGDDIYVINKEYVMKLEFIEYNNTYKLSNNDGEIIYKELTNNSPITSIRFNYDDNEIGYVITTLSDVISGTYTPQIPQGYKLIGYSLTPNSYKATFGLNRTIEYNNTDSTTLYEVYGKYRPLTTSFRMTLYKNSAEFNRVDKTEYLELVGDVSGMLREETDIINPSINIETPFINFNYVYIETFNRYYYVKNITSIRTNIWRVGLAVDVLMSYKDLIRQQKALIGRQENYYNRYLIDTEIICESNKDYSFIEIPNDILNTEESQQPSFITTILGAVSQGGGAPTNNEGSE